MFWLYDRYQYYRIKFLNQIYGHIKVTIYIYIILKHVFRQKSNNRLLLKCLTFLLSPIIFITIWLLRSIKALATLLIIYQEGLPNFVRLLDGTETMFLLQESPKSRALITTLFFLESNNMAALNVKEICQKEIVRIFSQPKFAKLHYTIARKHGYFYFKKPTQCMNTMNCHFRDIEIENIDGNMNETNKEQSMSEEQLRVYISAICNSPMPRNDKAFWEVHLGTRKVHLNDSRGRNLYPMVLRFHHVIGDAVSLFNMFTVDFQNCNKPKTILSFPVLRPLSALHTRNPEVSMIGTHPPDDNILCQTNGNKHIVWWTEQKPEVLDVVRSVKKKMKEVTTVNVFLTCFLEALDEHFKKKKGKLGEGLPRSVFLALPVMPSGFDYSSYGRNQQYEMSNHVSLLFMRVPAKMEGADRSSTILKRLELIKRKYDVVTNKSLDSSFNRWQGKVILSNLPYLLSKWFISSFGISVMVSNIPGCGSLEFFDGMKVKEFLMIDPNTSNSAITLMITSYENRLSFVYTIDKEVISDAEDVKMISKSFLHNLDTLKELAHKNN